MATDILIVDDEADIRELVAGILDDEGHGTRTAGDADRALSSIAERRPQLVFLDIWLQGSRLDGLALLDEIRKDHPDLPVVMISGHGNVETAVSAIKRGAYDYIEKPFKADRLILVAERALEASKLKREVQELKARSDRPDGIVGVSPVVNQLRNTVERIAPTNSRILISGPSGSGKEIVARAIHAQSARANGPFVVLNAAAITPERMEIELFGVEVDENGRRKVGALEEAHGGTIYLDEIADMPRETQARILRVLVDQSFLRVGGTQKVQVDVRLISSTARDLEREIADGRFREDLFHRLAVVPIRVPGLSERREDIPFLIDHMMHQIARAAGLPVRRIGDDAMAVSAGARLAGEPPPAPQQRGAVDDPDSRGPRRGDHGRSAAVRGGHDAADAADLHGRRASDGAAAARRPRDLRAGVSEGSAQPLRRQHLAHRRIRGDGALGAPSQAEEPQRLTPAAGRVAARRRRVVPVSAWRGTTRRRSRPRSGR